VTLLVAQGLCKSFGGVVAARDVSFEVAAGELVALIGPNGAGKSTTFNMVGGQLLPDAGTVTLDGADIVGKPPREIWRRGVGRTFQIAQTFVSMTASECVQVTLQSAARQSFKLHGQSRVIERDAARNVLALVGIDALADRAVSTLAYGDVKRVELAIALAGEPKLLLMDEPTAGMARPERHALMTLVAKLARERGLGVLFTEHDMDSVFGHATRVLCLVRGEIIAQGSPQHVASDRKVRELYLGSVGAGIANAANQARGTP
jgi:branched-chain amino acid transport system ATP-binding protein